MNPLRQIQLGSLFSSFGWSLLHFLWQGILAVGFTAVIVMVLRKSSAHFRYLVLCAGLVVTTACPIVTFSWIARAPQPSAVEPPTPTIAEPPAAQFTADHSPSDSTADDERFPVKFSDGQPTLELPTMIAAAPPASDVHASWRKEWPAKIEPCLPWLVCGWLVGVVVLSLRLLAAWQKLRRLRGASTTLAPAFWQDCLSRLASRLQIRRPVLLIESVLVDVPAVMGCLKPLILLPCSALTGLEPSQIEALLAHELAHIRRHDYLVNLIQTVIETLLFYHPAVWWLSRKIREERELCCDDLALEIGNDGLTLARALATMEELRFNRALALSADGGSLRRRILRIVSGTHRSSVTSGETVAPAGLALAFLGGLLLIATLAAAVGGRSEKILHADEKAPEKVSEKTEPIALRNFDDNATPLDAETRDARLQSLIEKIREHENRFRYFAATVRTSRDFQKPKATAFGDSANGTYVANTATVGKQILNGERYQFVGEDVTTTSNGTKSSSKQTWVCNGTETLSVIEGNCATKYPGWVESPMMTPPHTWGMFHLAVSFPLSVYLSGTETLKAHIKVGRHPQQAGSIYEFYGAEAEIVDDDVVDGLNCTVVLVKRWHYSSDPPSHQYLWLANDRSYHVIQTRTAFLRDGREVPREESRVKKWRKLSEEIWVPEVVEVVAISPEAVAARTTDLVTERLQLESAEFKPRTTDKMFELTAVPANLLNFTVDAQHRLVDSPHHPAQIAKSASMTLEAILDQLTREEKKYGSCEVFAVDRYTFLNPGNSMEGNIALSSTRQRSVRGGKIRYREQVQTSTESNGLERSQIDFKADDGRFLRSYSKSTAGKNRGNEQSHASILMNNTRFPVPVDLPHTLIFRYGPESARSLASFLRSEQPDKESQPAMTVEYVGDEKIDELLCHKLKCSTQGVFYFLWLARDRNLIPIRHEMYEPRWNATLPTGISIAEDLREIASGLWFPHRITNLAFQKSSRDGLNLNHLDLQWRHDVTVERATWEPKIEEQLLSEFTVPSGTKVQVTDERGQYLGDFAQPKTGPLNVSPEMLQVLRDQAQNGPKQTATRNVKASVAKITPTRQRGDAQVGKLLDQLEQQNAGPALFQEVWLRTMKEIIEIGPVAIPDLIDELDATDDDRMLRCLGFMLRAIDDKRAVPALIRAIPKTLRKPGSDMALNAFDADLFKFAQQHELNPGQNQKYYGFGRPVREICGALQKLTGREFNEQQLFRVFLNGMPPQWRARREQYYQVAKTWADWWEEHWSEFTDEPVFATVNLPPLVRSSVPRPGAFVETIGSKTGLMLQSVLDPKAKQVFYDIDADRYGELPEKWRDSGDVNAHQDEILAWAKEAGFDLMGTEYVSAPGEKPVFALRGIGLQGWNLDPARWKTERNKVTLELLRQEGRPTAGFLLSRSADKPAEVADPQAAASFLVVTSERSPYLLQVGVEVQNDRKKPGTFFLGDPELNPTAPIKGRRFAVMYLEVSEERK